MAYSTSTQHALVDQPLREFIRAYGNAGSQQDAWKLGMFLNATCITCTTKNVQVGIPKTSSHLDVPKNTMLMPHEI